MNYEIQTGRTIEHDFEKFHSENPKIYEYFKTYANDWINSGSKKISSKQIIGRIRWFVEVETTGNDFKINDAFTCHYARLFIKDHPEHATKFELRKLRSAAIPINKGYKP